MQSLETVYRDERIHVPREVQKKLRLIDGDRLRMEVVDEGKAVLWVLRSVGTKEDVSEWLKNPPDLGETRGKLTRKEIYQDRP